MDNIRIIIKRFAVVCYVCDFVASLLCGSWSNLGMCQHWGWDDCISVVGKGTLPSFSKDAWPTFWSFCPGRKWKFNYSTMENLHCNLHENLHGFYTFPFCRTVLNSSDSRSCFCRAAIGSDFPAPGLWIQGRGDKEEGDGISPGFGCPAGRVGWILPEIEQGWKKAIELQGKGKTWCWISSPTGFLAWLGFWKTIYRL